MPIDYSDGCLPAWRVYSNKETRIYSVVIEIYARAHANTLYQKVKETDNK